MLFHPFWHFSCICPLSDEVEARNNKGVSSTVSDPNLAGRSRAIAHEYLRLLRPLSPEGRGTLV